MKKPISATVDSELADWISEKLERDKRRFRNKSHLIETALEMLRSSEEKRRKKEG